MKYSQVKRERNNNKFKYNYVNLNGYQYQEKKEINKYTTQQKLPMKIHIIFANE